MCEYVEGCSVVTDPLADALTGGAGRPAWPREADADLLVLCPVDYHILAAVYDLPKRGRVLCTPHFRWGPGPGAARHVHAGITSLAALVEDDEVEYGRCRCGTWNYRPRQVADQLAAHDEGRALPADELVKARHPNGQVTKIGRAWAERTGLRIVGRVVRSPRLGRPYILGKLVGWDEADQSSGMEW